MTEKIKKQSREQPKRIAFLLRDLGQGGAERSALRLVNGLAKRGFAVSLLLARAEGPMLSAVAPEVDVVNLKGSFLNLIDALRKTRPEFLFPVYTSMRALLARMLLREEGIRVVLSQRNMFTMDRGFLQTRLRFLRARLLYPYASACVSISRGVEQEMKKLRLLPDEKNHVIYNPVVTEELLAQREEPPGHPWFLPGMPPVILGVGRLGKQKDFPTLLEAFALLAAKRPDVRLVILGEGKQRGILEERTLRLELRERVALPGYISNPYACMRRAALFVLTSRYEGFGNVVAEALACGCNVVSTDCPSGPAEILEYGTYGRLARVGDPAAVAEAMEQALAHPLAPEVLERRAAFFSEERAVQEYCALMERLSAH